MNGLTPGPRPGLHDWIRESPLAPLVGGEVRVLKVDLASAGRSDDDPTTLAEWPILADDEQARALRFVRPRDRRRFVICRGSLRVIMSHLLGVAAQRVAFQAGPGGKPALVAADDSSDSPSLRFNVSHSADLALIAVSLDRELGVDVEQIRPIAEAARIVESYFTAAEQIEFRSLDPTLRDAAFMRGWTRKEAVLKAQGVGLAGLARDFETRFGTTGLTECFTLASPLPRVQEWLLWEAIPRADHVAALAVYDPV